MDEGMADASSVVPLWLGTLSSHEGAVCVGHQPQTCMARSWVRFCLLGTGAAKFRGLGEWGAEGDEDPGYFPRILYGCSLTRDRNPEIQGFLLLFVLSVKTSKIFNSSEQAFPRTASGFTCLHVC